MRYQFQARSRSRNFEESEWSDSSISLQIVLARDADFTLALRICASIVTTGGEVPMPNFGGLGSK